jgi:NAD(P)-dependent dehydrogenase (short-subunit alcohol dehydrogenase family)
MSDVNPFSCAGRRVLITGGGTGLGLAMARCLHEAGATVVVNGRRAEVLTAALPQIGVRAHALVGDVTAPGAAEALVARAGELAGGAITVLINNAGVHCKKPLAETSDADFAGVLGTHVTAAFRLCRAAAPGMGGDGAILFMASMTSLIGMPRVVAYSAAKSAYTGMTRALASELATDGIRVNAIAPGWIESPMLRQALAGDPARRAKILARTPMARFGDPDDIGRTAVWLCSPAARFITGAVIPVDGGASIGF